MTFVGESMEKGMEFRHPRKGEISVPHGTNLCFQSSAL
jgi:hypothetical protein